MTRSTLWPFLEKANAILSILIMMQAFIPLLELGQGVGQRDDIIERQRSTLLPYLLFLTYVWPLCYLTLRGSYLFQLVKSQPILVVLYALLIISSIWSPNPGHTLFRATGATLTLLFTAYLIIRFSTKEVLTLLGITLGIVTASSVFFALFLPHLGISGSGLYAGTWNGVFQNKNPMGLAAAVSSLTFLTLALTKNGKPIVTYGFFIASLVCLLKTSSMTSFLAFLMAASILFFMYLIRKFPNPTYPIIIPIILAMIIGSITLIALNLEAFLNMLGRDLTLTNRAIVWQIFTHYGLEKPVLGYGYRGFLENPAIADLFKQFMHGRVPAHGHNIFIEMFVDLGSVGVVLLLCLLGQSFYIAFRRWTQAIPSPKSPWAYWHLLYLTFLLVIGMAEAFSYSNYLWMLFLYVTMAPISQTSGKTSSP